MQISIDAQFGEMAMRNTLSIKLFEVMHFVMIKMPFNKQTKQMFIFQKKICRFAPVMTKEYHNIGCPFTSISYPFHEGSCDSGAVCTLLFLSVCHVMNAKKTNIEGQKIKKE